MDTAAYPTLIPSFEHQRLQALQPYQVLGTPGQGLFNDLVGVVAKLFAAPIALVSLVRAADVVFVGNAGLPEATGANREDSLCSVAILQDGLTMFDDLVAQPCANINPLATRQMQLRFYAGQALRTPDGQPLGTLCVIDRVARQFSEAEGHLLTQLAAVAEDLLRLQAALLNNSPLTEALRTRLDAALVPSLTRLETLAQLRSWEPSAETTPAQQYQQSYFDEAGYLAATLHRELQATIKEFGV